MGKYKVLGYFTGPNVTIGLLFDSTTPEVIFNEIFASVGLGSLECLGGISATVLVGGIPPKHHWGKCLGLSAQGVAYLY